MHITSVSANIIQNSQTADCIAENRCNKPAKFDTSFQNKTDNDDKEIFNYITEWKDFCKKQILSNNIDFIA